MVDKLIVTNRSALHRKYGARGLAKVTAAVNALIAADCKLDLTTRFISLNSAAMKRYGAAVSVATSARQNKRAIVKMILWRGAIWPTRAMRRIRATPRGSSVPRECSIKVCV